MKPWRLLLAGTGTEVGKTTFGVRLVGALRGAGRRPLALKPIETGYVDATRSDAAMLSAAAGHDFLPPAVTSVDPLAPLRARLLPPGPVDLRGIEQWVTGLERKYHPEVTVVESAGGLFTPLSPTETNLDLLRGLRVDGWLLVARDRLGALHDCIATVTAARASDCSPAAVILAARDADPPDSNAEDLARCLAVPVHDTQNADSMDRLLAWILAALGNAR